MTRSWTSPRLTRRRLFGAGAAVGAGTVLAACESTYRAGVKAHRVKRVPLDDPSDPAWGKTTELWVALDNQTMAMPVKGTPMQPGVKVRALQDDDVIGFRLHWLDDEVSDETVLVNHYRDACAVLLGAGDADQAIRPMGAASAAVTLLHWKADWQHDVEKGRRSIKDLFPNVVVDTYPPLGKTAEEITPQTYIDAKATQWLPGLHVGNLTASATRTSPVEKLIAHGFGTSASAATQNATGHGARTKHGWDVVLGRPLKAVDPEEVDLVPGSTYTCAFALWSGKAGDRGSIKSPTREAWPLVLEA